MDERKTIESMEAATGSGAALPVVDLEARPRLRLSVVSRAGERIRDEDLSADSYGDAVGLAAAAVSRAMEEAGPGAPLILIHELVSNLVHASFREASIIIKDEGQTLIVADRGPGIADATQALLPGYSTATSHLRRFIRGTGLGLGLASEAVERAGGTMSITGNLGGCGTVVTVSLPAGKGSADGHALQALAERLTERQKHILLLIFEKESGGPTFLSRELSTSVSTVHRDLEALEDIKVIKSAGRAAGRGARRLTPLGARLVDFFFNQSV